MKGFTLGLHFETEAKGNLEIAYYFSLLCPFLVFAVPSIK